MVQHSEKERADWVRLIRSENVGPKSFQALMELYGSASAALEMLPQMSLRGGRQTPVRVASQASVEKEFSQIERAGGTLILASDPNYPVLLRQIRDYPPVITVYGKRDILNRNNIAIVGARNASANGCRFAGQLAAELGREAVQVVSGLARGIDTAAHQGSLTSGTVAVIAGGINVIYPPENKELYHKIAQTGAVITEMPYDTVPKAQHFPRRNRIISGMSLGTVVIEASLKSGSLITARMALEQDREVFAVPGSPLDPRCQGTNSLIKQGAHLVESADDVCQVLQAELRRHQKGLFDKEIPAFVPVAKKPVAENELDKARPLVYEKLGSSPTPVDDVVVQTGIAPNVVVTILLELELAGRLTRHSGNKVSLVYGVEEMLLA